MTYKHGAYAELQATSELASPSLGALLPVYIGVAPVHMLKDYSKSVNKPILIRTFSEAQSLAGYSDANWNSFDLCESVYAHFKNSIGPVGPIVLINVLDPQTHRTAKKNAVVALTAGRGVLENDKVILNTLAIAGKSVGIDFKVSYLSDGSAIEIVALTELGASVNVEFYEVDLSKVTAATIIGSSSDSDKKGIEAVKLIYPMLNLVPNILDAPGWSHLKSVRDALIANASKINGHWYAFVNTNIPSFESVNTIEKAKTFKIDNGYSASIESPCWPCAKNGQRIFHLSTLTTLNMCRNAIANNGYPSESPSNEPIDVTSICLLDGTPVLFDQQEANTLNEKGIKTAVFFGGKFVLWGPHTGAYDSTIQMDPADVFDSGKLMLLHILNEFQKQYGIDVDTNLNRAKVETILNDFQERLDSMPLLYGKIEFVESSNPTSDLIVGDFTFNISPTTAPVGKSISAVVQWTSKGIKTLFGGEA